MTAASPMMEAPVQTVDAATVSATCAGKDTTRAIEPCSAVVATKHASRTKRWRCRRSATAAAMLPVVERGGGEG